MFAVELTILMFFFYERNLKRDGLWLCSGTRHAFDTSGYQSDRGASAIFIIYKIVT
jgi:hypothetical protein